MTKPYTRLDRDKAAVLLVDHQTGLLSLVRDIDPDKFFLLVGNEDGEPLRKITLTQFLGDPKAYMTHPDEFKGEHTSLLAKRDTHVLASAQACFLPIPEQGK